MSILASVKSVSPAARTLTEGNRLVAFKSMSAPAHQVANAYHSAARPNRFAFSERVATESEDEFVAANEVVVGANGETLDDQVTLLSHAVKAMTFNARNVIVPTVDALVNQFLSLQSTAGQADVSVDRYIYDQVHSSPSLLEHVNNAYAEVPARPSYRSFILNPMTAEAIVSLVAENNPHLDSSAVVEWLLNVGADRIMAVWASLYGKSREFDHSGVTWFSPRSWPVQLDELLLAYCLTGALREQPQEVVGESVDLKEWEHSLAHLHALLGSRLRTAYLYRAQDLKNQRLILSIDAKDPIRTGRVHVLVNADVYGPWLKAGGDIQVLLGAAVFEPTLTTLVKLQPSAAELADRWAKYYPVLRQACVDNAIRQRRNDVAATFFADSLPTVEGLPEVDATTLRDRLDKELRVLPDDAYDQPCQMFTGLVCRTYYASQPLYFGFMQSMERYARVHPQATPRELAIEAVIELVASWLAQQLTTVAFTPDVDPSLSHEDEGGANVNIDHINSDIASDLGEIEPPPAVNELAEQDAGTEDGLGDAAATTEPAAGATDTGENLPANGPNPGDQEADASADDADALLS